MPSAIALGKEGFALGKVFVECCTRQRAVGISLHDKGFFAECYISGTRQRISRVPRRHSTKKSCSDGQVTVTAPLPSATRRHSAKKYVFYFFLKNTLPSACIWHSAKLVFFFVFGFSLPSAVGRHSAKQFSLSSVLSMALGKARKLSVPDSQLCRVSHDTRQRSEKFNFFLVFSLPSLQTRYTSYIYNTTIYHTNIYHNPPQTQT